MEPCRYFLLLKSIDPSSLGIEEQISIFDEAETLTDANAPEPDERLRPIGGKSY
ncbi:MAG: hypothetical protein QM644_14810 [Mobilitalea sp.]